MSIIVPLFIVAFFLLFGMYVWQDTRDLCDRLMREDEHERLLDALWGEVA